MKLVTYVDGKAERFGALCENGIVDLTAVFPDAVAFLEGGTAALEKARAVVEGASALVPVEGVRLRTPVPKARKLVCAASNYSEHIREGGREVPEKKGMAPWMFLKPASTTLVGPEEAVVIPRNANQIDWEGELCAVIGRRARFVRPEEALDFVAGYTILNDISERSLKVDVERQPRDWNAFFDWLNGKWFDTFAPAGPCLVLKDEVPDPQNLHLTLRVNGKTRQDGNTGQMIFSVAELVAWSSTLMTLEPGDLIATGTPSGVGAATGEFLKPGDVVECEVERIGVLRNPVRGE